MEKLANSELLLPLEIFHYITQFLSIKDVLRFFSCCKRFHTWFLQKEDHLLTQYFSRDYKYALSEFPNPNIKELYPLMSGLRISHGLCVTLTCKKSTIRPKSKVEFSITLKNIGLTNIVMRDFCASNYLVVFSKLGDSKCFASYPFKEANQGPLLLKPGHEVKTIIFAEYCVKLMSRGYMIEQRLLNIPKKAYHFVQVRVHNNLTSNFIKIYLN